MIIETEEIVLHDENEDYALTCIGGIWINFKESIPAPQATILTEAFNLIYLSDPDTFVGNMINEILIDENQDTAAQKLAIVSLFTNTLIDILKKLGCTINTDNITLNSLEELCNMVSFFYDLQEYEDVIGLVNLLESQDIPPTERFLGAMALYLGENFQIYPYEAILEDVSEVTVVTLKNGLKGEDLDSEIAPGIIRRVRANVAIMEDTLAYTHLRDHGGVGNSVEALMNFFKHDLDKLLQNDSTADQIKYAKEVTALYLVSELNSDRIKDELYNFLVPLITDHLASIGLDKIINQLDLS